MTTLMAEKKKLFKGQPDKPLGEGDLEVPRLDQIGNI